MAVLVERRTVAGSAIVARPPVDAAAVATPRTGAVAFVQRCHSELLRHVHLHVVWRDGVDSGRPGHGAAARGDHRAGSDRERGCVRWGSRSMWRNWRQSRRRRGA